MLFSFNASGVTGGVALGYNIQIGNLVYGVEGSMSFGEVDGTEDCLTAICSGSGTGPEFSLDRVAMLRGRLGVVSGKGFYFATLGVARAEASVMTRFRAVRSDSRRMSCASGSRCASDGLDGRFDLHTEAMPVLSMTAAGFAGFRLGPP